MKHRFNLLWPLTLIFFAVSGRLLYSLRNDNRSWWGILPEKTLSDADLERYARKDPTVDMQHTRQVIGRHHGTRVIAQFFCSDWRPQYGKIVVYYELQPNRTCEELAGREVKVFFDGQFARAQTFCEPVWPKMLLEQGSN